MIYRLKTKNPGYNSRLSKGRDAVEDDLDGLAAAGGDEDLVLVEVYIQAVVVLPDSREKIVSEIPRRTRAIVCINPGNPTGAVLTHEEMRMMVDIAKGCRG